MAQNPYLLVADGKVSEVLALLSSTPSLASAQDAHGYSLVHAAASYNEFDLLRKLVNDHRVDVDIRDEDDETPLFSVESLAAAKLLVEELGADVLVKGSDGRTAAQAIAEDGDYPDVAAYLSSLEEQLKGTEGQGTNGGSGSAFARNATSQVGAAQVDPNTSGALPPVPDGLQVRVGAMDESEAAALEIDPEFRARIEELASRDDLNTPEGQARLKQLVQDAVAQQEFGEDRNVRPKTD